MNRWLLTGLAWTSPDTKTLRVWKWTCKRGIGRLPWEGAGPHFAPLGSFAPD